jgi:hypothetical protein
MITYHLGTVYTCLYHLNYDFGDGLLMLIVGLKKHVAPGKSHRACAQLRELGHPCQARALAYH